jgi:hypothetical protein
VLRAGLVIATTNPHSMLKGRTEGKSPIGKPSRRIEGTTRIDVKGTGETV